MYPRVVIGIMHAAFAEGRRESLKRLLAQIGAPIPYISASMRPEPVFVYGRRMWRWASEQDADLVGVLNDDVRVCPDFVETLSSMCKAVPGEVIGLSATGVEACLYAKAGHNWVRSYNLTGQGYAAPPKVFAEMLSFWESSAFFRSGRHNADDTVGSQWLYDVQKPAWLSLPAIVQHDTAVASSVGHADHPHRASLVSWEDLPRLDLTAPKAWRVKDVVYHVPWLENPWFPTALLDEWRRERRALVAKTHVTITSTNRGDPAGAARCIRSVREQRHAHFTHLFVALGEDVEEAARRAAAGDERVVVQGPSSPDAPTLANLLPLWRRLPPGEVVVWLDGDDQLATGRALEAVVRHHEQGKWVTYGQFLWGDGAVGFASQAGSAPREEPWCATHLRSFRAGLVQRMRDEDFREAGGGYAGFVADQRVMIGVLELAGQGRSAFVPQVLCLYNHENSFELHGAPAEKKREFDELVRVRSMPRYSPLGEL